MHESHRRLCCRAAFLLLCLAPTVCVLAWSVFLQTPAHRAWQIAAWQTELSHRLGVTVRIGGVSAPQAGRTLFDGLELFDPETDAPLASVRAVEAAHNGRGWVLLASHVELPAYQLSQLAAVFHDRVLRQPPRDGGSWELIAGEVTLSAADVPAETFQDVRVSIESTDDGSQAKIEFRVAGLSMSEPAQLKLVRNRQLTPPATSWELNTGGAALPCSIFAGQVPSLAHLGEQCHFDGLIGVTATPRGWEGIVNGRLKQVDLDRLITDQFPHKLSGSAEIVLNHARIRQGRIVEAAGTLVSTGGVVHRSLLEAAAQTSTLRLTLSSRIKEGEEPLWKYRELAIGFNLDADGLTITGNCASAAPGTILSDRTGVLVAEAKQPTVAAVALVRTLAPQNEIQVPASQETNRLLEILPVPALLAPESATARRPSSTLRLRKPSDAATQIRRME